MEQIALSSKGNLVYTGNFNQDGLNVNNNWPINSNDNLGVALQVVHLALSYVFSTWLGFFFLTLPAYSHSRNAYMEILDKELLRA